MLNAMRRSAVIGSFLVQRRLRGFDVPDLPHFDDEGQAYFAERLKGCNMYLEYGSGGSTVLAARYGIPFISVDNDAVFHDAVKRKIGQTRADQTFLDIDTGMTGPWGYPIFKEKTERRMQRWRSYANAPWQLLKSLDLTPDLVLVDGRFRVACALVSFWNLKDAEDAEIIVDDYLARDGYDVIERFARLDKMIGSLAIFRVRNVDTQELAATIKLYEGDYK